MYRIIETYDLAGGGEIVIHVCFDPAADTLDDLITELKYRLTKLKNHYGLTWKHITYLAQDVRQMVEEVCESNG